jgi:hypothetical protein
MLMFAAFLLGGAAAVLTFLGAALVVARLAAVGVGAVGAMIGGAGGVGAGAIVVMALMLTHFGLSSAVDGLFCGLIVVASGHAKSKSGSY